MAYWIVNEHADNNSRQRQIGREEALRLLRASVRCSRTFSGWFRYLFAGDQMRDLTQTKSVGEHWRLSQFEEDQARLWRGIRWGLAISACFWFPLVAWWVS
jgi:hypothetical protein